MEKTIMFRHILVANTLMLVTAVFLMMAVPAASEEQSDADNVCARGYISDVKVILEQSTDYPILYFAVDDTGFQKPDFGHFNYYTENGINYMIVYSSGSPETDVTWRLARTTIQAAMAARSSVRVITKQQNGGNSDNCLLLAKNMEIRVCMRQEDCNN